MKISITINQDEITMGDMFEMQVKSETLGGGFDMDYTPNGTIVTWDFTPKDPMAFIEMVDDLTRVHSTDVLDNCDLVDVNEIAFNPHVDLYGIGDITHAPDVYRDELDYQ